MEEAGKQGESENDAQHFAGKIQPMEFLLRRGKEK